MRVPKTDSGPNTAQREWVDKLGVLGSTSSASKSFINPGDLPGKVLELADAHSNTCRITNNTSVPLRLDPASLKEVDNEQAIGISHGKYDSFPPDPVAPGSAGEFRASSNTVLGKTLTGVEGRVRYFLDDQGTAWTFHHNNPFVGSNDADGRIDGPNKANFTAPKPVAGSGDEAQFVFTINQVGGPPPGTTPTTNVPSSCLVTVKNETEQTLELVDQGHKRGDFMTFASSTLPPGGSTQFASVETPDAKEQGCQGFLVYDIGSPKVATWRIDWDNPEQAKNTTETTVTPDGSGFRALDQIGQGEDNVPVVFTLKGGPAGPPGVVPPGKEKEVEFAPPTEARQPTLRKGDKGQDGWVEYLQQCLNKHLGLSLATDGDFGSGTHKAVVAFQGKNKLMVDGVVGNQTWAALREGQPEKPSTDGREPHTYVERGPEARWDTENKNAVYLKGKDQLVMFATSVGDASVDDFHAVVRVTAPGSAPRTVKVKIGKPIRTLPSGAGHNHAVKMDTFTKTFPSTPPGRPAAEYALEAYLEADLGGDHWTGEIVEK